MTMSDIIMNLWRHIQLASFRVGDFVAKPCLFMHIKSRMYPPLKVHSSVAVFGWLSFLNCVIRYFLLVPGIDNMQPDVLIYDNFFRACVNSMWGHAEKDVILIM